MKKVVTILFAIGVFGLSRAQNAPVFSQHFINPYLYNPAFAGIDGAFSAFLTYRNQWVGIEDSPVTANLSFHMPLPHQLLVGAHIFTDNRGLLNTTSGLATVGYLLPLGDQSLRFGLSAGVGSQKLDMTEVGISSDPALINALENSSYLTGNFGVVFERNQFRLGLALPRIFDHHVISETSFQSIDFNPFSAYNISVRYKHHFTGSDFALEPVILYRGEQNHNKELDQSQLDLIALLHYQNLAWIGGSYRLDYGPTLFLGVKLMEKVHVGYGYEFALDQINSIGKGTHEIQLKFSLAPDKTEKTKKKQDEFIHDMAEHRRRLQEQRDSIAAVQQRQQEPQETAPEAPATPIDVEPAEQPTETEAQPVQESLPETVAPQPNARPEGARPRLDTHRAMEFNAIIIDHQDRPVRVTRGTHLFELDHGHYVVVAAFAATNDAVAYSDHLFEDFELETKYGYVSDTQHWYVYEYYSPDSHESAEEALDKARAIPAYHDAWILVVE